MVSVEGPLLSQLVMCFNVIKLGLVGPRKSGRDVKQAIGSID
jgi:hypothetical protein